MSFVNKLLVVLLISLISAPIDSLWIPPYCPFNCTCSGADSTRLWVDCRGRFGDAELLTEQLDALLSSNVTYGRLSALTIVDTLLTHVPPSVCRLTTLTILSLNSNRITSLPDCLSNLIRLSKIKAIQNNITQLQDGLFDGLQQLEQVILRQNQIISLGPRVFTNSPRLWYIDLSNNQIQDMDKRWIYKVGSNGNADLSAQINLQHNRISQFTNLDGLTLKCGMKIMHAKIDLRYNEIRQLSDAVEAWQLTLRHVLCIAPFFVSRSTVSIDVSHNPFVCDCKDYQLYWVDANLHFFGLFDGARCAEPLSLRDLEIDQIPLDRFICELHERCPPGCRCVYQPANSILLVDCSHTNLTALPLELPAMINNHSTYKLDFSSNSQLRQLENREYLHKASTIDFSNCGLTEISFTSWRELFQVKNVFLHSNRLSSLPRFVATLNVSTEYLSLHNNPWRCSCGDKWMAKWLRVVSKHVSLAGVVLCESPARLSGKKMTYITDEEFCVDPVTKALTISMSSVVGVAIVLLCLCIVVYRLRVRLYTVDGTSIHSTATSAREKTWTTTCFCAASRCAAGSNTAGIGYGEGDGNGAPFSERYGKCPLPRKYFYSASA